MSTKKQQPIDMPIVDFDPLKMVEDSINSGFDPAMATEIDERDLNWCPNIWEWIVDPDYLGITTIYPIQIQVLLKLMGDVCPWCSDFEFYVNDFEVTADLGAIRDRIQLLEFGKCPKCGRTRCDQFQEGFWLFPNELDLLWGMRCSHFDALVYTDKGLIKLKDVNVGDTLTHGDVSKKFDSGTLPSLLLTTDMNWVLTGAKESHIVPVLNVNLDFEYKLIKECKIGDYLVLHSPDLWATDRVDLPKYGENFPTEVTPELATLLGYMVSCGKYAEHNLTLVFNEPASEEDFKRCCLVVFGEEPKLERVVKSPPSPLASENAEALVSHCLGLLGDIPSASQSIEDIEIKQWSLGDNIIKWLHSIGIFNLDTIPDIILRSPKDIVFEFLRVFFYDSSGIYRDKLLYIISSSKVLIEQIRLLLLNLGVRTSLSEINSTYLLTQIFQKGGDVWHTPIGDFQLGTEQCPDKIIEYAKQGYFFDKIKEIKDGPDLPMMDVHIPETNIYTADGFVHHNSGKSAITGILASYHLHRFLKISDPASYYRLLKGSLLVMRFVALTAGQANESIWHQFTRSVETCAWFGQYHDFLKHHEKRMGVELNRWLTQSFGYVHKKITGYYIGASIDTSRGRTAIGSFFDEIGWWLGHDQSKRANPHETYQAYQKASRTIRNAAASRFAKGEWDVPTAIMSCASSTSSKTDYIMHLIKLAKRDHKRVASHKASWEVNPEFAANPDELKAEREANYKTFLRDYGSVPPFADSPFFDNEDAIMKLATLPIPTWNVTTELGNVGYYLNAERVEKNPTIPYCLAIDLGLSNCGYAAALLKLKENDFSTVQIAGLFAIYPNKKKGENVDLSRSFIHFIKHLCEALPIRLIVYDQWQSKSQIQELQGLKITAEQYSLTYNDFSFFRMQVLQSKLEFPEAELPIGDIDKSPDSYQEILCTRPYLHFLWQMLSVSEVGKKIGKGDGHDDLFRAVVLGCRYLWDDDWRRDFEYKQGMMLHERRLGKGRLVISAGSRSGQLYNTTRNNAGYNTTLANVQGKSLGAILVRSKG